MSDSKLQVMVLAGGPDRERPVSLQSGAAVTQGLRDAGHSVQQADIGPDNLAALDRWVQGGGDVIFPVLHGPWGEGGPLQRILEGRQIPFVGCASAAAALCIDKHRTKQALIELGLPTPESELTQPNAPRPSLLPPLVIKPLCDGSSIDVSICHNREQVDDVLRRLKASPHLLVERYVHGCELTVGILSGPEGDQALPPIQILPATDFYDYQAKYKRDDTQLLIGSDQIQLPNAVLDKVQRLALATHRGLGCRHLSRVDLMVDEHHQPWILEVNTMPGFTSHSLLPQAAAHAGVPMPALVNRLVRLAVG